MDGSAQDGNTRDASHARDATSRDAVLDARTKDAARPDAAIPTTPGGKRNFSVVYGNLDTTGTTWVRHANYTFTDQGTVASSHWHWESSLNKGKTAHTSHRCTFENTTKDCSVYVPTGWVDPAGQYTNRNGTFTLDEAGTVSIDWADGQREAWQVASTSSEKLHALRWQSSNYGITHGKGYGSNADWKVFRTLPEIVSAGGRKAWRGQRAAASSSDRVTINASDWGSTTLNLESFTSASSSSEGYTLHAMLPHSPNVCTGACSGERKGKIMYHLASQNKGRQMAYNNWCTCLSIGDEWPCYTRNMHPWALMSVLDDDGVHRGWLFIEQQNQTGYPAYQYQLGDFTDL